MRMDDPAYTFQAFSGIPSVSFQFTDVSTTLIRVINNVTLFFLHVCTVNEKLLFLPFQKKPYPFFGTMLDTRKNLEAETSTELLVVAKAAGEIAGVMALRLVHDHLLRLNVEKYRNVLHIHIDKINREVLRLQKVRLSTSTKLRKTSVNTSKF